MNVKDCMYAWPTVVVDCPGIGVSYLEAANSLEVSDCVDQKKGETYRNSSIQSGSWPRSTK